ncbi:hypothetical protein B0H14DRAFT_2855797 [Mycena olivaceomarginata]|nr:hypothetical protein B0H14DRAFT_2855797 [Mycena olivaceomarginata]
MALLCIHLHGPPMGTGSSWAPLDAHFTLFLSPAFPNLRCVVLHDGWTEAVADPRFARVRAGLRAQNCQIKFPDGRVC